MEKYVTLFGEKKCINAPKFLQIKQRILKFLTNYAVFA